jgi:hypothetical protein
MAELTETWGRRACDVVASERGWAQSGDTWRIDDRAERL